MATVNPNFSGNTPTTRGADWYDVGQDTIDAARYALTLPPERVIDYNDPNYAAKLNAIGNNVIVAIVGPEEP